MIQFGGIPPVVKNLLIINVLVYIASQALMSNGLDLYNYLALHWPGSDNFQVYQVVSYMFMHSQYDFLHLVFNMFGLFMFGRMLEQTMGPKRFLTYYMVTGIGAAFFHLAMMYFGSFGNELRLLDEAVQNMNQDTLNQFLLSAQSISLENFTLPFKTALENVSQGTASATDIERSVEALWDAKRMLVNNYSMVGASGSVFGILLAFGMLFPNLQIMLLIPPIPIKAKYFVLIYGIFEFTSAIQNNPGDNVAHFAHLGGMLFGFLMLKFWKLR